MQRPRCSVKLPNKRASTCPTTRSVSILMRASGGAWADASAVAPSAAASLAKQRQLPRFTLDDMVYLSLPACARSCGFDDQIRILNGVSRSDQADSLGNTFLELNMRFKDNRHTGKRLFECQSYLVAICGEELLGHEGPAGHEVGTDRANHVEHFGNIVDQGNVDGLYLRPERKTAIRDHQCIGMADAADERVNRRVQDSGFQHKREHSSARNRPG